MDLKEDNGVLNYELEERDDDRLIQLYGEIEPGDRDTEDYIKPVQN